MNTDLQARLSALDTSLATLLDSLISQNPSLAATQALLVADTDLQASVKQLSRHQANHNRISALKAQITSLNTSITERLSSLATLRSEILAQDIRPVSQEGRQVEAGELLGYAQRISRFTVPPTHRPRVKQAKATEDAKSTEVNGTVTEHTGEKETVEHANLANLDLGGWVPWPSEDIIRQGPLGQLQAMNEQDVHVVVEPEGVKLEGVAEGNGETVEEDSKGQQVELGVRVEERVVEREQAVRREVQREEKPKVFGGLDLYDPDEE